MKQKIILHIGHGKTGSSAIQAALARNRDLLGRWGIAYPDHPSLAQARSGMVTSGNLDPIDWFEAQVIPAARRHKDHAKILFSDERLLDHIGQFTATVGHYLDRYDFELVIFVRHPVEMLASTYHQAIKRSGFFGDIAELASHIDHPIRISALIERLEALGVGFRLFNYSKIRRDAVGQFFDHLAPDKSMDDEGDWPVERVNRSLTLAELRFVRDLNRIFGAQYGALVSDALVNRLPDLPAETPPIAPEIAQDVLDRNTDALQRLNRHLDVKHRFAFDGAPAEPAEVREAGLSAAQAEVIRQVFPATLIHADGPILRDIAMKHESGEPLTRRDAIALMEYAQKARPHGRIIADKLDQWRSEAE